jgi:hypothetical protein
MKPIFKLLKDIIFSVPDKRYTIKETIDNITEMYDNLE